MSADGRPGEPPHPHAPTREEDRWMAASWLFLVEPAGPARCRVISRYRCDTSGDLLTRLQFGPAASPAASYPKHPALLGAGT